MLDTTVAAQAQEVLDAFGAALEAGDIDAAAGLFEPEGYWRDLVSFTWNIKTMKGRDQIAEMLRAQLATTKPTGWHLVDGEAPTDDDGVITAWVGFETAAARGHGLIRIRNGKIWTLLTTMVELKGHEEPKGFDRPLGALHGSGKNRPTWKEQREREDRELGNTRQPYCLIVGGGQGAIGLAARLKHLGVPTIVVEKNERPGDSWRKRYKSLCLHDPVWYDHLPYLKFPDTWPVFSPKDKIGDWLEMYVKVMELAYWTKSTVRSATWDASQQEWAVTVDRDGTEVVLRPKQLVMATGMSGKIIVPELPGKETFRGEQHHSSQHPGPDAYRGKKVVVVGSNNSAHDIAAALWEADADVTMVQRSSTLVARSETLMAVTMTALYSEEAVRKGVNVEKADLIFASIPYGLLHEFQLPLYQEIAHRDAEFYKALEAAGFWLDWGDDKTGLFMKYLRRGSGYYIDIGASQLIIDGEIKLKRGQVTRLVPEGVVLDTGETLPADLIVYATGYGSMNGWVADLMGQDMADRIGKVWGLGSGTKKDPGPWEGELRNMWKPTQVEGLWMHGGNLHQSRHYSQFLALQLKARMEGIPTPVFGLQEVHHTS
jgi:putative flavoprotein involved in K+ transport